VADYLGRLFDPKEMALAFRPDDPGGFPQWQAEAGRALRTKLGIGRIAISAGDHRPKVHLEESVDCGDYTRQRGTIETEPGLRIPFWLLRPKHPAPWPVGLFPHGHDTRGHDTTAGVFSDAAHEQKSHAEDRDVAVQAVKLGFLAIAPATRGISTHIVPDLDGRHGERDCRAHVIHCLLAGRTAIGERVWDLQRILDWALTLPGVDQHRVLMMGNSGGGMVTMFAAACDERITVAVPSCSFAPSASVSGYIFHCDCNTVPGLMELGGLPGVVGLAAPRHVLAVNGRKDSLFAAAEVERAAAQVRLIYRAAGAAARFQHRWGDEGHRFYRHLMWPFVRDAMRIPDSP
jgi:dienelactone hydrolase